MVQSEEDEALPPTISLDAFVQQELKEEPPSTVQHIRCGTPEECQACIRLVQRCLQCPVLPAPRPTLSARRALLQLVCDESGQLAADEPATLRLPEPKAAAAAALADLTAQLEQCSRDDDSEDQSDRDASRCAEAARLRWRRKALERASLPLTVTPRRSPDSLRKGAGLLGGGPSVPATRTLQLTPAEAAAPASGTKLTRASSFGRLVRAGGAANDPAKRALQLTPAEAAAPASGSGKKLSRASSFGRLVRAGGAASGPATRTLQPTPATAATPAPGSGTKLSRASSFGRLVRKNSFGRAKASTASGGGAAPSASHAAPSIGTVASCASGCEGGGEAARPPGSSPQPPSAAGGAPLPLAPYVAPGAREAGRAYEVLLSCLISPTSPLHLPYISPTSPLHLPYISPTSPLCLPYICPMSPLHLPYVSPMSPLCLPCISPTPQVLLSCLLSASRRQALAPSLAPALAPARTPTRTTILTLTLTLTPTLAPTLTRRSSPPPPESGVARHTGPPPAGRRAASSRALARAGYSCRCPRRGPRRGPLPTRAAPSLPMAAAGPASPPAALAASPPPRPHRCAQPTMMPTPPRARGVSGMHCQECMPLMSLSRAPHRLALTPRRRLPRPGPRPGRGPGRGRGRGRGRRRGGCRPRRRHSGCSTSLVRGLAPT